MEPFVSTELKTIEDQYTYLLGIGIPESLAMNMLFLSIELQKVNIQARVIAKSHEEAITVESIAAKVIELMEEGRKDSEDGDSGTAPL